MAIQLKGCDPAGLSKLAEDLLEDNGLEDLNISGSSDLLASEDGVAALINVLRNATKLQKFNAHITGLTSEGLAKLAEGLSDGHCLEEINIAYNDCLASEAGVDALASVLRNATKFRALDVSNTGLTGEGLAKLAEALPSGHGLEELRIEWNTGILASEPGISALAEILCKGPKFCKLVASGTGLTGDGLAKLAEALPDGHDLEELDISSCESLLADAQGGLALGQLLCKVPKLRKLDACRAGLTIEGLAALAEKVPDGHGLEELSIQEDTSVLAEEPGLAALIEMLRKAPKLRKLRAGTSSSGLGLTSQGLAKLSEELPECLEEININNNNDCLASEAAIDALASVLRKAPKLRALDAGITGLTGEGLAKLAEALPSGHGLEELCIEWNKGILASEPGISALAEILCKGPKFRRLVAAKTGLAAEGLASLAEKLPDGHGVEELCIFFNWDLFSSEVGVDGFLNILRKAPKLNKVNISSAGLSDEQQQQIEQAWGSRPRDGLEF